MYQITERMDYLSLIKQPIVEELNDFIRKHLFERAYYYNQADLLIQNGMEDIDIAIETIVSKLF